MNICKVSAGLLHMGFSVTAPKQWKIIEEKLEKATINGLLHRTQKMECEKGFPFHLLQSGPVCSLWYPLQDKKWWLAFQSVEIPGKEL